MSCYFGGREALLEVFGFLKLYFVENPAPFMVSSPQITHNRKSDLEISPAEYYPLYRKHRVTVIISTYFLIKQYVSSNIRV